MRDIDEHARNLAEAVDMALFDLEPEQVEALLQQYAQDMREMHDKDEIPRVDAPPDVDFWRYHDE